jgi:hypothetical protein
VDIVKFVVVAGALIGVVTCIRFFNDYCRRRFGHRLFTLRTFWLAALAINATWLGLYCYTNTVRDHASLADGLVLLALSISVIVWITYENIRETDFVYGLVGSALQLALFFPVALYSFPFLLITMAIMLFASFKAGPTWLVDH